MSRTTVDCGRVRGIGYALCPAVLGGLLDAGLPVDLVVSRAARLTLLDETGLSFRDAHWRDDLAAWLGREPSDVGYWSAGDLAAGPASGSYRARGMVVVPASTAALAGIAIGLSKDLLQRAADVTIKERRPLVVVPREAPYSRSALQHMLALHDAGAVIVPASPGFYGAPSSVAATRRLRCGEGARRHRRRARSDRAVDGRTRRRPRSRHDGRDHPRRPTDRLSPWTP